ncbi:MAG TPA: gas vesicle protein GvpG [Isosphaeraceae bacterium]|nr:gas vesicle protein GvpG [Isosphaeraceae bacterium]
MFLADDVLLFPFKSILSVFQEIYNAAVQELAAESDSIRAELSQLYLALEAGTLSEEAFDARERELLDRLDAIEKRGLIEDEDEDEDEANDNETDEWDEQDE